MATNIVKGNIGNALHSIAPDHTVATSDEIFDVELNQYQDQINKQKSLVGNANASAVENKVNAMMDCLVDVISKIVFHSGTPYPIPQELQEHLALSRYNSGTTTPAICGQAICGQTICGTV